MTPRNLTPSADRKLRRLAGLAGLDPALVRVLASGTWDYDPDPRGEAKGWVEGPPVLEGATDEALAVITSLPEELTRDRAVEEVMAALAAVEEDLLRRELLHAGATGSYRHLSPYATTHFLRHATEDRLASLWRDRPVGRDDLVRDLFLKVFRGGSVDRDDLAYAWTDLVVDLPDVPHAEPVDWLPSVLDAIAGPPIAAGLSELIAAARQHTRGDRHFRQTLLEALSYAGLLEVAGWSRIGRFWPEHQHVLARRSGANEWTVPLRLWAERGGHVTST
ncbi:MAG: hypothetical protein KC621_33315 [Myxococcales bacterium]|nr:hypothetical protein [Myxococcales bacterium]